MVSLIFAAILLMGEVPSEPQIPSRFTCPVVRLLYKKFSKSYSMEEMESFLRNKRIPEDKIQAAKRCLS